jgi:hypothetical protein
LREAIDGLRDELVPLFEREAAGLFADPWAARQDYDALIADRSGESRVRFFEKHAPRPLGPEELTRALRLLEMQRHAQLMYTSCGWFFDELSGLETLQVLQYAGRAVQLARKLGAGDQIEHRFLERLARAVGNLSDPADGRRCYERFVLPAMIDLTKVGAHYAISTLFSSYGESARVFCYQVEREDFRVLSAGNARFNLGRVHVASEITLTSGTFSFGALHLGDHNMSGGIREFRSAEEYEALAEEFSGLFRSADLPEIIRATDRHFGSGTLTLTLLFRDELRRILNLILAETLADAESAYKGVYEEHAALMRFLTKVGYPLPRPLQQAAELALNSTIRHLLESEDPDLERLRATVDEAVSAGVPLTPDGQALAFREALRRLAERLRERPEDIVLLRRLDDAVEIAGRMPFEVVLWEVQNVAVGLLATTFVEQLRKAGAGEEAAAEWLRLFRELGERLAVSVPKATPP